MTIVSPPPRVFHALLQMVLSADGVGDEIARDLGDEFERDFREVGRRIAGARYRRRVVEVALYYVWDHVRGRTWARSSQGRPSPAPQRDLGAEPRRRLNTLVESLHTLHNDVRIAVRMLVKRGLYEALSKLEADLHEHIHKENNILFPRAVELEARQPAAAGGDRLRIHGV